MTTSSNIKSSRAVSFSESSQLYIVPVDEHQDHSTIWYSSEDKHGFRQSMVASIRKVSREIEELPIGAAMTPEQLTDCLGIESFIVKGAARTATECRRAHINAILSEQRRQKRKGTYDVERLSSISQKGSLLSTERAWKLGRGYAAISMDWDWEYIYYFLFRTYRVI